MGVAFRAGIASTGANTTSFTLVIPASVVTGDLLILSVTSRNHTNLDAYPTVVDNDTGGNAWTRHTTAESSDRKATTWTKVATAGTAGKTITVSGCIDSCGGALAAYSGHWLGGDPITNVVIESNIAGDETHAGFTPDFTDSFIVFLHHNTQDDVNIGPTSLTCTNPGAITHRASWGTLGGLDSAGGHYSALQTGLAATGAFTWTQIDTSTITITFAIRPDAQTATGDIALTTIAGYTPVVTLGGVIATAGVAPTTLVAYTGVVTLGPLTATAGFAPLTLVAYNTVVTLGGVTATTMVAPTTLAAYGVGVTLGGVAAVAGAASTTLAAYTTLVTLGGLVATSGVATLVTAVLAPTTTLSLTVSAGFATTTIAAYDALVLEWWQLRLTPRSGPLFKFLTRDGSYYTFKPRP